MSKERRLPKTAVTPLMEHCKDLSEKTGRSAAEIFKEYLELMKKHGDYFFSEPWPENREDQLMLKDEDVTFVEEGKSYKEKCTRFTLVCLKRNISLKGFDPKSFTEDFEFYGNRVCYDCPVPEAMDLRKYVELVDQRKKEIEENMKGENPSWYTLEMHEHLKKPEVIKEDKMVLVKLRVFEELGGAEGKTCEVKNVFKCPYGEQGEQLIKIGRVVKAFWRHMDWCNREWERRTGEPPIVNLTDFEDVLDTIDDGRLSKIMKEHEKQEKEIKSESQSPEPTSKHAR